MKRLLKYSLIGVGILSIAVLAGCTPASRARFAMSDCRVTLYAADGTPVRAWTTKGRVLSEDTSDGWYFTDAKTGKLVIVTGTLVIESD